MKNFTKRLSSLIAIIGFGAAASAQCPGSEVDVTVEITTDSWGYECYWEYTPTGDACGTNTLGTFANTVVGCAGGGGQAAGPGDPGAYANNTVVTENLGCLVIGTCFDIHYVDDWADGGAGFQMYYDGIAGETFAGSGAGNTFMFCAVAAAQYDAAIDSIGARNPYTMLPLTHAVTAAPLEAQISSVGAMDVTNATVTADVMIAAASQFSASSTPIAVLAAGASQLETFTPFTFSGMGVYDFYFSSSITEADEDASNDTLMYTINVNDSIMARDNMMATGTLGVGGGENAFLGQVFRAEANEMITSASAQFGMPNASPTIGDSTNFVVYDMAGGTPNAVIGTTAMYVFTPADTANGVYVTMMFNPPVSVTAGTDYFVAVSENGAHIALTTDNSNVELGSTWVMWDSAPTWTNSEDYGFVVQYILRANFNDSTGVSGIAENTLGNKVSVYPNPSSGEFTVALSGVSANELNIVLTDVNGKTILTKEVGSITENVKVPFSVQGLKPGVYFLNINADNQSTTERVTIAK